ncbi:c-type cytochrome [Ancylobacter vacuolatus]|uniref:Cytochrome c n=1 Tax=Ancylobacter vacuolatus TaxID=223389 RepID=A0ABU0DML2_9HYPH|nr:cytochrome c family protein [Ancylobacter vacuolatus]MDQ0349686.1 cytochrome c [Ancylobacter vacuolatus]
MDSFELNKVAGAVLGVLTLTLGLNVFADILFSSHGPEKAGYEIAVQEELTGEAQAAPAEVPLAQLLAAASPQKGEAQAKKCAACHNFVEGAGAKVGPDLYGIVGRPVAGAEGFAYSAAMKAHGGNWTFQDLSDFIKNPKADIPGTAMGFAGIAKDTDRADLIAYLNTLSHSPLPLPSPEAAPAAAEPAATVPASGETGGNVPPPAGSAAPATTVPAPTPAVPAAPEAPAAPAPEAPAAPAPEAPAAPAPAEPAPASPAPAAPATP